MFFEIFKNNNGQFFWHAKAANGKIVAYSGETYINKADCISELNKLKANASTMLVYDKT